MTQDTSLIWNGDTPLYYMVGTEEDLRMLMEKRKTKENSLYVD